MISKLKKEFWGNSHPLKNTPFSLSGYSRAANVTGFYVKELDLMLDAGMGSHFNPKIILITHSHTDHCFQLPMLLTGITTKPKVVVPSGTGRYFEAFLTSVAQLTCETKSVDFTYFTEEVVEVKGGSEFLWSNKNSEYLVSVLACSHSVTSVGYGVSKIQKKLKPEFSGRTPKELKVLKALGTSMTTTLEVPLFLYLGDSDIQVFENEEVFRFPTVITECTYLNEPELAEKNKHICLSQLKKVILDHPDTTFMVYHFSLRYSDEELKEAFSEFKNVIPLI